MSSKGGYDTPRTLQDVRYATSSIEEVSDKDLNDCSPVRGNRMEELHKYEDVLPGKDAVISAQRATIQKLTAQLNELEHGPANPTNLPNSCNSKPPSYGSIYNSPAQADPGNITIILRGFQYHREEIPSTTATFSVGNQDEFWQALERAIDVTEGDASEQTLLAGFWNEAASSLIHRKEFGVECVKDGDTWTGVYHSPSGQAFQRSGYLRFVPKYWEDIAIEDLSPSERYRRRKAKEDAERDPKSALESKMDSAIDWMKSNPKQTVGIASSIAAPFVAPVALAAIGFSATGVVAGTVAAAWQASIGNVAAGSIFAGLTSTAMTYSPFAAANLGVAAGGAVASAVGPKVAGWFQPKPKP